MDLFQNLPKITLPTSVVWILNALSSVNFDNQNETGVFLVDVLCITTRTILKFNAALFFVFALRSLGILRHLEIFISCSFSD